MLGPSYWSMEDSGRDPNVLDDLPPFMTIEQTAKVLQIGRSKAYELAAQWENTSGAAGIPCVRVGYQRRVPKAALMRHFADLTGEP